MQIYMPEINLQSKQAMSKDELAQKCGLESPPETQKPLLMQVLEGFLANEVPSGKP